MARSEVTKTLEGIAEALYAGESLAEACEFVPDPSWSLYPRVTYLYPESDVWWMAPENKERWPQTTIIRTIDPGAEVLRQTVYEKTHGTIPYFLPCGIRFEEDEATGFVQVALHVPPWVQLLNERYGTVKHKMAGGLTFKRFAEVTKGDMFDIYSSETLASMLEFDTRSIAANIERIDGLPVELRREGNSIMADYVIACGDVLSVSVSNTTL